MYLKCTNNKPKAIVMINLTNWPADTSFYFRITERSDTLIIVRIIEGSYNGGSDNRGSTVFLYIVCPKSSVSPLVSPWKINIFKCSFFTVISMEILIE